MSPFFDLLFLVVRLVVATVSRVTGCNKSLTLLRWGQYDAHDLLLHVQLPRPVLVRGAQRGAKWDDLRASWSKSAIAGSHPDVVLKTASIPYAKVFGFVEEEQSLYVYFWLVYAFGLTT